MWDLQGQKSPLGGGLLVWLARKTRRDGRVFNEHDKKFLGCCLLDKLKAEVVKLHYHDA